MENERFVNELKKLDTPCVSDALDKLGIPGGLEGIKSVVSGVKLCGPAFTVRYAPCGVEKNKGAGDYLDDVPRGGVVVIDNSGRQSCTSWGDILSVAASRMGIAGTVIDGVCRDIPVIRELGYAIFTKGYYMVTGKDRVQMESVNAPVTISGVLVKPGDIILGDDSGVVAIPLERAEEVLKIAKTIEETEGKIIEMLKNGMSLKEARAATGYHTLQSGQV